MTTESKILVRSVTCKSFVLRTLPTRHFTYEVHVKWSSGQSAVICRRYSQFFNLQCKLLDTFALEAGTYDPSRRTLPFLPGKKFVGNLSEKTAEKRRAKFDIYLKALIALAKVGCSDQVLKFLECKESDLVALVDKKNRKSSKPLAMGHVITGPVAFPQYIVIQDYTRAQKGELSVTAGTVLIIVEKKHTGWWLAQVQDGDTQGWVPASYLDPVYGFVGEDDNIDDELSTLPAEPEKFVTTSDYTAGDSDELSLARGCVVDVITKNGDGWWRCRNGGKEGMFPSAYLYKANTLKAKELLAISRRQSIRQDLASAPTQVFQRHSELSHYAPPRRDGSKPKPPRPPLPPAKSELKCSDYLAIADFANTMNDGIDLTEGSRLKVLTKDDSGWWFVEIEGAQGWAPSTYIQPLNTNTTNSAGISFQIGKHEDTSAARSASPLLSHTDGAKAKVRPPTRPGRPPSGKSSPTLAKSVPKRNDNNEDISCSHVQALQHRLKGITSTDAAPHSNSRHGDAIWAASVNGAGVSSGSVSKVTKPLKPVVKGRHADPPSSVVNNNNSNDSGSDSTQLSVSELKKHFAANLRR